MRKAEQKALRSILKVKQGTSTDLLYNEHKRPDIISKIKNSQYKFYQRLLLMNEEDALVKSALRLCNDTQFVEYYNSLAPNCKEDNIRNRERSIGNSNKAMLQYYSSLVDIHSKSPIYSNFIDDRSRAVITRWRLSNHKLYIETGRYGAQYVERIQRKCWGCHVLEDENHAIFFCPAFEFIRIKYTSLLDKYVCAKMILNPNVQDIYEVANLLSEINKVLDRW